MNKNRLDHPAIRIVRDLLILGALAAVGLLLYGLAFQFLIMGGVLAADVDGEGYGLVLTHQAMLVWSGAVLLGLAGVFLKAEWRWTLLAAPAYAPTLYALMAGFSH